MDIETGRQHEVKNRASYDVEQLQQQWKSWLVPTFVVANIAVFVAVMYVNNCPENNAGYDGKCVLRFLGKLSFQPLRENPLFGPSSYTLLKMGALEWYKIVYRHQGWRLISCVWLHAGVVHLLANMLSLAFIGVRLERQFGFVRVGMIYVLSGFGGSVMSSLFIQQGISVGASGALFGLLGAMLSELITNWTIYTNRVAVLFTLIFVIAINLAVGILPRIDNFAHIGGFASGFLLGFVLLLHPQFGWFETQHLPGGTRVKSKYKVYQIMLLVIALVLLIAGFTMALWNLFRGGNAMEQCSWCHYLSCVPASIWRCD